MTYLCSHTGRLADAGVEVDFSELWISGGLSQLLGVQYLERLGAQEREICP